MIKFIRLHIRLEICAISVAALQFERAASAPAALLG